MKLLGEFQDLLLSGVELGLESVSLPFKLYPIPLQVFERGGYVRMKDSVRDLSFHNRFHDNWENGRIRHHKFLSTSSHPLKVRLKGDGIIVSQGLTIHLVGQDRKSVV